MNYLSKIIESLSEKDECDSLFNILKKITSKHSKHNAHDDQYTSQN